MAALRAAAIGECMIELTQRDGSGFGLGYAGDTFNTALYLARLNPRSRLAVDYVTALGDDPYSEAMLEMWRQEGVGTDHVARLPGKLPGLYLIRVDSGGERRFFYYRSAAAARELFRDAAAQAPLSVLPGYDLLYLSAITLSVLSEEARARFLAALAQARRNGARVAFDSNYRPAGWSSAEAARETIGRFLTEVDIALPTFEDEQKLFGDADASATAARYQGLGIGEVAVKLGSNGAVIGAQGPLRHIPVPVPATPVDTTGAGDAFNAGYLSGRLAGWPAERATLAGHALAGAVIQHPGAIIPRRAMPDLGL